MKKMRGLFRIIFGRTAFVVLFMAIQVGILFGAFRWLEEYMHIVYAISILLSAVVIIYIFNEPINSSFKMAWIVPVLVIPVFGVLLYIFVQMQFQTKLLARRLKKNIGDTAPLSQAGRGGTGANQGSQQEKQPPDRLHEGPCGLSGLRQHPCGIFPAGGGQV